MRELSAEARLHLLARSLSGRSGTRIHLVALYSAFALIAAWYSARCQYTRFELTASAATGRAAERGP